MPATQPRGIVRFGKTYTSEELMTMVLKELQSADRSLPNREIQGTKALRRFTTDDISAALRSLRQKNLVVMYGVGSQATWSATQLSLVALAASQVGQPGPKTIAYWACPPEER